jgi:hypothetical protein
MRKPVSKGIGPPVCLLALIGLVAACEKTMDPATGERTIRVTMPGTAAHGGRMEERWRRCLLFNPESLCARRLPGERPGSGPAPLSLVESGSEEHQPSGSEPEVKAPDGL